GRDQRDARVALSGNTEVRTRGNEHAAAEETARERLARQLAFGQGQPEEEAGVAARVSHAHRLERGQHDVALGTVDVAHGVDVLLVAPRRGRGTLDELLRRDADVGPVALERRDDLRVAGREPAAVAGHRRALAERVERDDVRAIDQRQRRYRRVGTEVDP